MLHLRYDFENSDNCDTAGKILRYYCLHKGYSTRELAEKVGVVPATITLYENDKISLNTKLPFYLPKHLKLTANYYLMIMANL